MRKKPDGRTHDKNRPRFLPLPHSVVSSGPYPLSGIGTPSLVFVDSQQGPLGPEFSVVPLPNAVSVEFAKLGLEALDSVLLLDLWTSIKSALYDEFGIPELNVRKDSVSAMSHR